MSKHPNCRVLLRTLLLALTVSASFLSAGCHRTTPSVSAPTHRASAPTHSVSAPTHSAPILTSAQKAHLKRAKLNKALMDEVSLNPQNITSIKRLLAAGADPTAKVYSQSTGRMLTAYQAAIWGSDADVVALFLDRGTPVNFHDPGDDPNHPQGTLDWAASCQADARTIKVLLAHGADRRYLDHALLIAVETGDMALVQCLSHAGAHRRQMNYALFLAAGVADVAMVRSLLDAGADVNYHYLSDGWGMTPLIEVVSNSQNTQANVLQTMRLLLSQGANVNARDSNGMTPLIWAVASDEKDKVRLLLAHKADLRLKDVWGETALGRAKKYHQPAMVQLLEKAGAKK